MLLSDEELDEAIKKFELWTPPTESLASHISSIMRRIEDLRKSRDNWRKKYEETQTCKEV